MAKQKQEVPHLEFISAGNINQPYRTIDVIHATVAKQEIGCDSSLPVGQALRDATDLLKIQAYDMGGNGIIHINYMYRVSTSPGCSGSKSNFEVYAWGTCVEVDRKSVY